MKYDMLGKMTYLDKCIQETLRMYPPAIRYLSSGGKFSQFKTWVTASRFYVFM